jgi:hypothetical protein
MEFMRCQPDRDRNPHERAGAVTTSSPSPCSSA